MPLAGDWNGDGIDGIGIYRNTVFMLRNTLTGGLPEVYIQFGGDPTDRPLAGDWDGDGIDTPGVHRGSQSYFYLTNQATQGVDYFVWLGIAGDVGFAGDWDGDSIDGVGVFRPSNGITYLKNALVSGIADVSFVYGIANDIPVAGKWILSTPPSAPIFVPRL